jgi:hypothetical protein
MGLAAIDRCSEFDDDDLVSPLVLPICFRVSISVALEHERVMGFGPAALPFHHKPAKFAMQSWTAHGSVVILSWNSLASTFQSSTNSFCVVHLFL